MSQILSAQNCCVPHNLQGRIQHSKKGGGPPEKFKFKNLFSSVSAYGVGSHRHMAEIDQELSKAANTSVKVFFTPHLIPMFRGILSTIYLKTLRN